MRVFQRRVGLPAAVALAAAAFGVDDAFGPRPLVWLFQYGTVLFYLPWLAALALISAGATYWAGNAGASRAACALVAVSPALAIGGVVTALALAVAGIASLHGQRVYPWDAVGHFLIGWLLVPGGVGILGAAPFLRSRR